MSLFEEGTILVTGGAGFIGSSLVWELNRRGHENIIISDRLGTDEKWKNLRGLRYTDFVDADVLLEAVEALVGEFEGAGHRVLSLMGAVAKSPAFGRVGAVPVEDEEASDEEAGQ